MTFFVFAYEGLWNSKAGSYFSLRESCPLPCGAQASAQQRPAARALVSEMALRYIRFWNIGQFRRLDSMLEILMQRTLFDTTHVGPSLPPARSVAPVRPFKTQLLKWIGNKQRFAHEIVGLFPQKFGTYFEPFLGSGAVLGTLSPPKALGSDCFAPLMGIWQTLKDNPNELIDWYASRLSLHKEIGKIEAYEQILNSYNRSPNSRDFLFLSRACYGGVVRFRKDGYMSTPCGVHEPISVYSFKKRVNIWHQRVKGAKFDCIDYKEAMVRAVAGDLVYCDPPYSFSQAIIYGAQRFDLHELFVEIANCKKRGVYVVLSIDGSKKSGNLLCNIDIPHGLFEREIEVDVGRSMLRRFQKEGQSLEMEVVKDRLLLTY